MGIRENFYIALRNEFDDNPSESFLFRFLLEERKKKGKNFAQAPLDELLDLLANLANRNQKIRLSQNDWDWLLSLGKRIGGIKLQRVYEIPNGTKPVTGSYRRP